MNTTNLNYEKSAGCVAVNLYKNPFVKEDEYVGRIACNTVNLTHIIAGILEHETMLDPAIIHFVAGLIQKQTIEELQKGNRVNLLDLCCLYAGLSKVVKGKTLNTSDIPPLEARVSPTQLLKQAVENITIKQVRISENLPAIIAIIDTASKKENECVTPGDACIIKGDHLKLEKENSFIEIIPLNELGEELSDHAPIKIESDSVYRNTPRELFFKIPTTLSSGSKCKIRITTIYNKSSVARKDPISIESDSLFVN